MWKRSTTPLPVLYRTTCFNVDVYDHFCHYLELSVWKFNTECCFSWKGALLVLFVLKISYFMWFLFDQTTGTIGSTAGSIQNYHQGTSVSVNNRSRIWYKSSIYITFVNTIVLWSWSYGSWIYNYQSIDWLIGV